jgi:leader peptidase (prepilin peptidase)/N-methyltransferase
VVNGWWVIAYAATGIPAGSLASMITRQYLREETKIAGTWWFGTLITIVVLAVLCWRLGARGELAIYAYVAVLGVPLAVIDWIEHRLPRVVVWPQLIGAAAGFVALILQRQLGEWVAAAFVVAEAGLVLSSAAEA